MILYVKNMVSERCKLFVEEELRNVGIRFVTVDLGIVDVIGGCSPEQLEELETRFKAVGLEVMVNRKSAIIEKIEATVKEMIHEMDEVPKVNYSDYISERLDHDYAHLSNIFSEAKGVTIQQYIIINKIERVKELLMYTELNLTEISYKLHYSSVAHLSNQFKKVAGRSPSSFKRLNMDEASSSDML